MTYKVETISASSIAQSREIVEPRFQRKKTWTAIKNFKLTLSFFKNYPLGVMVMKREVDRNGEELRSLLDGRQRKTVLEEMRNPVKIYEWSKKALGILNSHDENDITQKFWSYLIDYIGEDKKPDEGEEEADFSEEDYYADEETENKDHDMETLLSIILTVHEKPSAWRNGLTRPFEFLDFYQGLDYYGTNTEDGGEEINAEKLCGWIRYRLESSDVNSKRLTQDEFFEWLERDGNRVPGRQTQTIKGRIDRQWIKIQRAIRCVDNVDTMLTKRTIPILYIIDGSAADAMKIFDILNTEGMQLTASEILSAKYIWNKPIEEPNDTLVKDSKKLYEKQLEFENEDEIVRWDRTATFMNRIKNNFIFGDFYERINEDRLDKKPFENFVTLGFKIMSGYYLQSISKAHMETLAKDNNEILQRLNKRIAWESNELETKINRVNKVILENDFFKFLNTWKPKFGFTIKDVLSEAISINFLLIMLKDWEKKGEPNNSNSGIQRKFRKNAIILFDRLVYESLMNQWKGSSDSRISNNLRNLDSSYDERDLFIPIKNELWERLIEDIVENGEINGESYLENDTFRKKVKILLWYYYALNNTQGPDEMDTKAVDIEHIIPQTKFDETTDQNLKNIMNNIKNLSLLPSTENQKKSGRDLNKISKEDEPWLVQQIEKYSEISNESFEKFDTLTNAENEIKKRGINLKNVLISKRNQMIA